MDMKLVSRNNMDEVTDEILVCTRYSILLSIGDNLDYDVYNALYGSLFLRLQIVHPAIVTHERMEMIALWI